MNKKKYIRPDIIHVAMQGLQVLASSYQTEIDDDSAQEEARGRFSDGWYDDEEDED